MILDESPECYMVCPQCKQVGYRDLDSEKSLSDLNYAMPFQSIKRPKLIIKLLDLSDNAAVECHSCYGYYPLKQWTFTNLRPKELTCICDSLTIAQSGCKCGGK